MILSRQDLSDPENVKDCVSEFRRANESCVVGAMACWAGKWGEAICARLVADEDAEADEISDLKGEIAELKANHKSHIADIIDAAVMLANEVRDLQKVIQQ